MSYKKLQVDAFGKGKRENVAQMKRMPNGQLKYCLSIIDCYNKGLPPIREFQQRKLPDDAGEWPAKEIQTAR